FTDLADPANSTTCTQEVSVVDDDDPTITCPTLDPFYDANSDDAAIADCFYIASGGVFNPAFDDNCPGATISHNFADAPTSDDLDGAAFPIGSTMVTWTVTDGANNTASCQITVVVEESTVANDLTTMACSDEELDISLVDQIVVGITNPEAIAFTYTVSSSNPGLVSSGPDRTDASTDNITDTYTNLSLIPVDITYTVTPVITDGGTECTGDVFTVTVTIKPEPAWPDDLDQTVCSNEPTGVLLTVGNFIQVSSSNSGNNSLNVGFINGGGTATTSFAGLPPIAPGENAALDFRVRGDVAPGGGGIVSLSAEGYEDLIVLGGSGGGSGCVTRNQNNLVLSNAIMNDLLADGVIEFTIESSSDVNFIPSCQNDFRIRLDYDGVSDDVSFNITAVESNGLMASAGVGSDYDVLPFTGAGSDVIANDTWTNTRDTSVDVSYKVVPISPMDCPGDTLEIIVTVHPEPVGRDTTIFSCSGDMYSIPLDTLINNNGVDVDPSDDDIEFVTYNWEITDVQPFPDFFLTNITLGDTGTEVASGGSPASIDNTTTSAAGAQITVTYTITPVSTNGCEGEPFTADVVISPPITASIDANGDNTLCGGEERILDAIPASGMDYEYSWMILAGGPGSFDDNTAASVTYTAGEVVTQTTVDIEVTILEVATNCSSTAVVSFTIDPSPIIADSTNLAACEVSGAATFDLNMGVPNPGVGEAFTFYTSFADAENGGVAGQIADPAAYVATLGTTTIFARLTNSTTGCFDITSFTVTVNPLPTVDITGELEICAGETTTLVASGGTSFQWDEDAGSSTNDTVMVTPSVTTTYSVTVTDDNGCMASDSVTVIVNPLPTASITVSESSGAADDDGTICEGDEATLTAAGGAVFSWSTGASTQSITVSPEVTTTYIVTVTDINGCSDTASQEIIVDPLPTFDSLTVSATEVCQDESVDFTLNGLLDLETTVTYTISDGVNPDETETITGTPVGGMAVIPSVVAPGPGTYTITIDQITIGDCSIIPTENNVVVVLVKPNPTIAGITADPTEICVGDDITFTAAGLLNGPATFDYEVYVAGVITPILTGEDVPVVATDSMATIMASDLFPDLSLVPPGAYSVVVTSITVNGCETTTFEAGSNVAFFLVNPLPVFADGEPANLTECEIVEGGGTAIFDLEEAVELSLADNLSITFHTSMMDAEAGQNAIIDVNAYESGTTDIFARIEDLFTGCFDVASFTINVLSLPMVSIEAVDDICEGSETPVDLVGTPMGGTFSGTGVDADSSQFDPTGLTAGDYIVTYTFLEVGSGCVNTAEITITIVPNPIVEITAPIMEICVGESVTLTASGAVTYEWTNDIDDSVLAGESITVSPSVTTI
ncbi:MAG: PKD-like domain-containing protein, partial [Bacteroidota bacterium]